MTSEQLQAARALRWRQTAQPLLTLEDAQAWLDQSGLVLFLPRRAQLPAPAPSFVEAVLGEANATPPRAAIEQAQQLAARLIESEAAVPLHLLGVPSDHPDFLVSAEALPFVYALRGDRDWKRTPGAAGSARVSPLVAEVWKFLDSDGASTAIDLKDALGKELTEAAVLRALHELWSTLRIVPRYQTGGEPPLWEPLSTRHGKAVASGAATSQVTALSLLLSLYLETAVAATSEEAEIFLSPLTSRTKVREAIRGLSATRQLTSVGLDRETLFHVTGALPEFPAVEAATVAPPAPAAAPEAEIAAAANGAPVPEAAPAPAIEIIAAPPPRPRYDTRQVEYDATGAVVSPSRPAPDEFAPRSAPRSASKPRRVFDREAGERPAAARPRAPRSDAGTGERPRKPRTENDRPRTERPRTERTRTDKPRFGTDKPGFGTGKPRFEKPRAEKPGTGRPGTGRPGAFKPRADKPATGRFQADRPWAERPDAPPTRRPSYGRSAAPGAGRSGGFSSGRPPGKPASRPTGRTGARSSETGSRPSGGGWKSRPRTGAGPGRPSFGDASSGETPRRAPRDGFASGPRKPGFKLRSGPGGFSKDRPAFSKDRPAFGKDRPAFSKDRPSFGKGRPPREDRGPGDFPPRRTTGPRPPRRDAEGGAKPRSGGFQPRGDRPYASRTGSKPAFKPRSGEKPGFKPRSDDRPPFKSRSGEKSAFKPRFGDKPAFKPRSGDRPAGPPRGEGRTGGFVRPPASGGRPGSKPAFGRRAESGATSRSSSAKKPRFDAKKGPKKGGFSARKFTPGPPRKGRRKDSE